MGTQVREMQSRLEEQTSKADDRLADLRELRGELVVQRTELTELSERWRVTEQARALIDQEKSEWVRQFQALETRHTELQRHADEQSWVIDRLSRAFS